MISLLLALCAFALGFLAGWICRGRTMPDVVKWWNAGWNDALAACGFNPLEKRVRFARVDELVPKVLHDEESR